MYLIIVNKFVIVLKLILFKLVIVFCNNDNIVYFCKIIIIIKGFGKL